MALCSLSFCTSLLFFFHLFEHCSPATLTNDLAFNCSATFFHTLLLSKRSVFSSRKEINSLVLFDDHVISFSSFSSSAMKQNLLMKTFVEHLRESNPILNQNNGQNIILTTSLRRTCRHFSTRRIPAHFPRSTQDREN